MTFLRGLCAPVLVLLILVSCRVPDEAAAALGEVPDTISEGFRQVSVSPEGRAEITAGRVEAYVKADYSVFYSAKMKELSPEGVLRLEGRSDELMVRGSHDGRAEGNIFVRDVENSASLRADVLAWNDSKRQLTGEGRVYVETGDGLNVSGEGFSADMARETFSFSRDVRGTLEMEDDEQTAP